MHASDLETLARRLAAALRGERDVLCRTLVRELSCGRPVTSATIAHALQIPEEEVKRQLAQLTDAERDQRGQVVGWGLSLIPTPHRFLMHGQTLFTWCALDALTYPALLDHSAQVESHCPITGSAVTLTVTPEDVKDLVPATAVISLVLPEPAHGCDGDRETFCKQGRFFASIEAARQWQGARADVLILPIEEAYQLAQRILWYRYEAPPLSRSS